MKTRGLALAVAAAGFAITVSACTSDGSTTTVKEQVTSKAAVSVNGKMQYRLYVAKNQVTPTATPTPGGTVTTPYPWVVVNRALYNATSKGDYYEEDRAGTVTVHTSSDDSSGKTIDSSGAVDGTSGHVGGADGEGHGGGVGDGGGGGDG